MYSVDKMDAEKLGVKENNLYKISLEIIQITIPTSKTLSESA